MPIDRRTMTQGVLATAAAAASVTAVLGLAGGTGGRQAPAPSVVAKAVAAEPEWQDARMVAVTFDDLPAIAQGDRSVAMHTRITDGLLRQVAEQHVPAIGFVNEEKLL